MIVGSDIKFAVSLLKVPPLDELSGWEVFDLMVNARHIVGDYWMFEGIVDALIVHGVEVVEEGETVAHGGMDDEEFEKYARTVFDTEFDGCDPSWLMLSKQRELQGWET